MPMPALDPLRYVAVMPVDPTHKVPREDGLRSFSRDPANPDVLDLFDPYEAQLLAGGSLRRACEVETADAQAAAEAREKAAAEDQARKPTAPPADPAKSDLAKSDLAKSDLAKSDPAKTDPGKPAA